MKKIILRLIILVLLVFIGLFAIKQVWYFGDYCIGMENTLAFYGLLALYFFLLLVETNKNLQEKKWQKKEFDKSATYITIGLIVLFAITQSLNAFKSKVKLTANTDKGFGHELRLRNNGNFELIGHYVKKNCHYYGKYKWNNDTLELDGKGEIDGVYFWDKTREKLISKSGYYDNFSIEKPANNNAYNP